MLLHDDGHRLWSYRLDGHRQLLWSHPANLGKVAAASPGGRELAYIHSTGEHSTLYLLTRDGNVRRVEGHGWLHDPVFLRPARAAAPRLYWSRMIERRGRSQNDIRVLGPEGPRSVRVDLRRGEYPYRLAAYPGSPILTLVLGRWTQPPRPALLMLLRPAEKPSPSQIGELLPLRDIDNGHGVAWLSPTSFVLLARSRVRLVAYDCAYAGSRVRYSGRGIDGDLVDEGLWPLVPLWRNHVLVVPALPPSARRDEGSVMRANERPLHWSVLDLGSRRVKRTPLVFSERGWLYVQPDALFRESQRPDGCAGFREPPS
jgi:hypothetical protein